MKETRETYEVILGPLRADGVVINGGDKVELTKEQAEVLLQLGVVKKAEVKIEEPKTETKKK
jgi:hypothetical protein